MRRDPPLTLVASQICHITRYLEQEEHGIPLHYIHIILPLRRRLPNDASDSRIVLLLTPNESQLAPQSPTVSIVGIVRIQNTFNLNSDYGAWRSRRSTIWNKSHWIRLCFITFERSYSLGANIYVNLSLCYVQFHCLCLHIGLKQD